MLSREQRRKEDSVLLKNMIHLEFNYKYYMLMNKHIWLKTFFYNSIKYAVFLTMSRRKKLLVAHTQHIRTC